MARASIAAATAQYIASSPALKEGARRGLLNYSELGRQVAKIIGTRKVLAASTAARRYAGRIKRTSSREEEVRRIILKTQMTIRTRIMVAIVKRAGARGRILKLVSELQKLGADVCWIEGLEVGTILMPQDHIRLARSILGAAIEETISDLCLIHLLLHRKAMLLPGFSSFLLTQIAERRVNLIEVLTCSGEMLLVLRADDLSETIRALEECGTKKDPSLSALS
ncbi:MAG: hypothetical protein DCC75_04590 [Proteobacteria bacterium]|nr:MAG: hypothetical protein DCC75_04590 [Pseudomonadota bacterium]